MTAWGPVIGALALGVVLVPGPASADAGWVSESGVSGAALHDQVGVGVHLAYAETPYADAAQVASALHGLGVTHVRDDLYLDDPAQAAAIATVHAGSGARFDLIAGKPGADPGEYVATAAGLGSAFESLEGPNEWDLNGGATWAPDLRAYQSALYAAAHASFPVLAPALAFPDRQPTLGSLAGSADVANAHAYPGGEQPGTALDPALSAAQATAGVAQTVVTETGYHDAATGLLGQPGVPEDVAGLYAPRLVLESALRGVSRTYLYELVDERADTLSVDAEGSFGLMRHDWTPKPAYTALQTLLRLAGTGTTRSTLTYRLTGPSDMRHLLVDRGDGSHVLFLWREVSAYDQGTRTPQDVADETATLELTTPAQVATYEPSQLADALSAGTANHVTAPVGAGVTALVIG